MGVNIISGSGVSTKWVKSKRRRKKKKKILQGLGVAQAAATECWLYRPEKQPKISFCKKTFNFFFIYILSSYAKILGGEKNSPSGVTPKWVKSNRETESR